MHVFNRPSGSITSQSQMHVFDQTQLSDSAPSLFPSVRLVHIRNDPVRHGLHVPVPVLAVLSPALLFVTALAVEK
jgi:hypothetical protein